MYGSLNILLTFSFLTVEISEVLSQIEDPCPTYDVDDTPCDPNEINFFIGGKLIPFNYETNEIGESDYDWRKPLTLILHDAEMNHESQQALYLRSAYEENYDYNIIMANYPRLVTGRFCFNESNYNLIYIGKCVATFLKALMSTDIHTIGIGLGAKLAATISIFYEPYRLTRATGFDPAGSPWGYPEYALIISPSIANYTDVIHTNGNKYHYRLAHSDWYLNNGLDIQPGCGGETQIPIIAVICSYSRSLVYFAESVRNKNAFYGVKCENPSEKCPEKGPYYRMGESVLTSTVGQFVVSTNSKYPFGKGKPSS